VEAIERRLEDGECADTLIQLSLAVRGAAGQLAAEMATLHLADCVHSCMVDRVPDPETRIQRLVEVIRQLVRNT
jgi:DNA-binding FrmR family transcriptional regulator